VISNLIPPSLHPSPICGTENIMAGHTMMMEWKPEHAGRWLFHCHFQDHISTDERVPNFTLASASPSPAPVQPTNQPQHDAMPTDE
jgi:Multicopper oxidase